MSNVVLLLAVASCVLLAPAIGQDRLVRNSRSFELVLNSGALPADLANRLADDAAATLALLQPALERWQLRPAKPLHLHLHADPKVFQEFRRTHATELANASYTPDRLWLAASAQTHVRLACGSKPDVLAAIGLPPTTIDQLLLAGARAAVCVRYPVVNGDPWRAEVGAEAVAASVRGAQPQTFDLYRHTQHRLLSPLPEATPPSLQLWLEQAAYPATNDNHTMVAARNGLLVGLLSRDAGGLRKLCSGKAANGSDNVALVEGMLSKDWVKNERRFRKEIDNVSSEFALLAGVAGRQNGRWLLVDDDVPAVLCSERPLPDGPYAIHASVELPGSFDPSFRVQLDWDTSTKTLLGVFCGPVGLSVELWEASAARWTPLLELPPAVKAGQAFEISIEVRDRMRVVVDGLQRCNFDFGRRTMRGQWSVAVNGSPAWLTGLRQAPLPPETK